LLRLQHHQFILEPTMNQNDITSSSPSKKNLHGVPTERTPKKKEWAMANLKNKDRERKDIQNRLLEEMVSTRIPKIKDTEFKPLVEDGLTLVKLDQYIRDLDEWYKARGYGDDDRVQALKMKVSGLTLKKKLM
jgi:hypothetical protein